jgi:hypothetical protein
MNDGGRGNESAVSRDEDDDEDQLHCTNEIQRDYIAEAIERSHGVLTFYAYGYPLGIFYLSFEKSLGEGSCMRLKQLHSLNNNSLIGYHFLNLRDGHKK